MSIRSKIAIVNKDGSVRCISCHNSGMPEWNGRLLMELYSSAEQAQEIIELGNLSGLGRSLEPQVETDSPFDIRNGDGTTAHHRDWNRKWSESQPTRLKNLEALEDHFYGSDADYVYAFIDGEWMVYTRLFDWIPVSQIPMRGKYANPLKRKGDPAGTKRKPVFKLVAVP